MREFNALHSVYLRARGVPKPLTREEKQNLESGRRHIHEAWIRAHNKVTADREAKRLAEEERLRNG